MSFTRIARRRLTLCASLLVGAWLTLGVRPIVASVPPLMNYQGQLSNNDVPLDGSFPMTFALFSVESGGGALWSETYPSILVDAGVFSVLLGEMTPLPIGSIFSGSTLWIETTVDGITMSPRRPIVSVAYAARAAVADSALYAPPAAPAGALVYTRWGRTTCPPGATSVYAGTTAGSHYSIPGSGGNLLCMTPNPTWDSFNPGSNDEALLFGAEYKTGSGSIPPFVSLNDREVPCAVCLREDARVSLMIPGTQACPAGWTAEYSGYLMSSHNSQFKSEFICVDRLAEGVGSPAFSGGALLYPTEAECGSLPCGPYVQNRELTCVVCIRP